MILMTSTTLETELRTFTTAGGAQIFQLPLLVFPGLWGMSTWSWQKARQGRIGS